MVWRTEKHLDPVGGFEPRFLGYPAHSLSTVLIAPTRLRIWTQAKVNSIRHTAFGVQFGNNISYEDNLVALEM
jgi:hypothetical protein